ncbi:MAG TPA: hypothetical protein DER05_10205 [Lutibacter sp.]|nr:hypothetical protein [Lutibacter sp.]
MKCWLQLRVIGGEKKPFKKLSGYFVSSAFIYHNFPYMRSTKMKKGGLKRYVTDFIHKIMIHNFVNKDVNNILTSEN